MDKMLNIALPKGRLGEVVYQQFAEAGFPCPALLEKSRKLTFENPEVGVRYFWVKPSDVAVYVERGAADIGVAGKDILLEYQPDVYELADLDVGKCRMAVAGFPDKKVPYGQTLRVEFFHHIEQPPRCSVIYSSDIIIIKIHSTRFRAQINGLSKPPERTNFTLSGGGTKIQTTSCYIDCFSTY